MVYNFLVVESPKKAKTIEKILGSSWRVAASYGHIRDLPEKDLGVDVQNNFKPTYVITAKAKPNITKLKELAASANEIFLATDLDREGEAIAYHLALVLGLQAPKRVGFNEITASAIQNALSSPRMIDRNLVLAQETRRIADRLVGYEVSPILCQQANQSLSAGRVQTPALRLVVDLEIQIRNFIPKNYYEVFITLDTALLLKHNSKNCSPDGKHLYDKDLADQIAKTKRVTITKVDVQSREITPKSPLTTSLLQQVANSAFKLSAAKTMEIAQHLFETGHITYHRTDNPNMSDEGFREACACLLANGLTPVATPHKWAAKDNAQEAHEAIRPTNFSALIVDHDIEIQQVYALIHERALASAMPSAIDQITTVEAISEEHFTFQPDAAGKANQIKALFKATATLELSKGWRELMKLDSTDDTKEEAGTIKSLPAIGDVNAVLSSKLDKKITQPPSRYTEGSLIKKLENLGIGRPSTYASILQNIISKGYIQIGGATKKSKITGNSLFPTSLGEAVIQALMAQEFVNYSFTSDMEKSLDEIAKGQNTYVKVIRHLYETLKHDADKIKLDTSLIPKPYLEAPCPKCGVMLKRIKNKETGEKAGYFWAHVEENNDCDRYFPDLDKKPITKDSLLQSCPYCQGTIKRVKNSKSDQWCWVHTSEPTSCSLFLSDEKGVPVDRRKQVLT